MPRARVDRRTKHLLARVQPGEVAVIDHDDLDRVAAEGLVLARVSAVVNAARSITGRYPNVGPLLLAAAGIPLIDDVGPDVFEQLDEGSVVRVDGGEIWLDDELVGKGRDLTRDDDLASVRAVLDRVLNEVEQRAAELVGIATNDGKVGRKAGPQAVLWRARTELIDDLGRDLGQVDTADAHRDAPRLNPAQVEQVGDQPMQAIALLLDVA